MLSNFFKIALRNLMRSKIFSLINVAGLAIGIACFMFIASFVYDELNFDNYAVNSKNIYRVELRLSENGGVDAYPNVDVAVGAGIKNAFPEVLESVRVSGNRSDFVSYQDVKFKEDHICFADANFLNLFSIPLIEGDNKTALTEPNSIVITKAFAKKYFGDKPAVGQQLVFARGGLVKVTGVIEKVPDNSHFHFDAFISMSSSKYYMEGRTWSNIGNFTYLLLNEHSDPKLLEAKFPTLVEKYVVPEVQADMGVSLAQAMKSVETWKFLLVPLRDIHLYGSTKYELEANGDINYVYIFSALGFFILLLACINFTNLSTASSARRSKEVGIRKSLGSLKNQLVNQFLTESIVLAFGAIICALIFVIALLPFFNQLTGKHISYSLFLNPVSISLTILLGLLVGFLAGIYPAFFLSSFQTISVLKGSATTSNRRGGVRSALVIFQFAISTTLIIAVMVVYQQLHFMQHMKLGYERDQIVVVSNARALGNNEIPFKERLLQNHSVIKASISNDAPVGDAGSFNGTEIYGKGSTTGGIHSTIFYIDYDYLATLEMKIVAGRNFSKDSPADSSGVIINETAMRDMGWNADDIIGKIIVRSGQSEYHVIGVVADFHYTSAKQKIAPLMMLRGGNSAAILLKVEATALKSFIPELKKQWTAFNANEPLNYYFLDERFSSLYKAEEVTQQLFIVFVVIAIIIACLGLYGLSAYSAEQRIKEIGIRKVLGSSVMQILVRLSKEFLLLIVIAIVVSIPLSWWAMHQWLQNFSYRIDINLWIFVLSGVSAIIIALITVSYQAITSAMANPVTSLRSE